MYLVWIAAGVSLSASVVSWVIGQRTAEVEKEIAELESQRQNVYAADARRRMQLLKPYLDRLRLLATSELELRKTVEAELYASLQKARALRAQRFGSLESQAVLRVTLELELSLSQAQAERVYLQAVGAFIGSWSLDVSNEVPAPGMLQFPVDFPRAGLFVQSDSGVPETLHGYRLEALDSAHSCSASGVLVHVDHERQTAGFSVARAALHEANMARGQFPLPARVVRRGPQGVLLETVGDLPLVVRPSPHEARSLVPESEVEVYPAAWTLSDLRRAGPDYPLPVTLHPPVDDVRDRWPCIPLALADEQIPELAAAAEVLADIADAELPWRMQLLPSGELAFSMGKATLITEPSIATSAFTLLRVQLNAPAPLVSVRVHAVLAAFVPGTADDKETERSHFLPFLHAMHNELDVLASRRHEQQTALRLRKLSLIYQDQERYLRDSGSTGVALVEHANGGRTVTLMLLSSPLPEWLGSAVQQPGLHRMRACSRRHAWDVGTATWVNEHLGLLQLELNVPGSASLRDIDPQGIQRLELAYEGAQQQTLTRALERTIVGRFASANVHATLMGLPGHAVANERYGNEAVQRLFHEDTDVMAIWGPPGTGKTTTLIKWMLSLFPAERPETWPTILLTAPTHVAVNKLLSDLLEKAPWLVDECVRYCGAERIADSGLEAVWHQNLVAALNPEDSEASTDSRTAQRWRKLLTTREGREAAARWVLGSRHIHAATCIGMARRDYGLNNRQFDIAIIDEAGKAFGAELMIPCAVARRVVLVGDHNQLPPTVTSESLNPKIGYRLPFEEVKALLEHNTFEIVFEQLAPAKKAMLTRQYRMHADIGSVVSQLFYDGKLESHRQGGEWRLTRKRLTFLDFSNVPAYRHSKAKHSDSQENPVERAALRALLRRLSETNTGEVRSLLVVCPYKAQRLAVLADLAKTKYSFAIDAATVDAVQGGEADMVILLMTRSHGSAQFLLDRHRLNVALSRARDAVVILGHRSCLTRKPGGPFERLLEIGKRENTFDCISIAPDMTWKALAEYVSPHQKREHSGLRPAAGSNQDAAHDTEHTEETSPTAQG